MCLDTQSGMFPLRRCTDGTSFHRLLIYFFNTHLVGIISGARSDVHIVQDVQDQCGRRWRPCAGGRLVGRGPGARGAPGVSSLTTGRTPEPLDPGLHSLRSAAPWDSSRGALTAPLFWLDPRHVQSWAVCPPSPLPPQSREGVCVLLPPQVFIAFSLVHTVLTVRAWQQTNTCTHTQTCFKTPAHTSTDTQVCVYRLKIYSMYILTPQMTHTNLYKTGSWTCWLIVNKLHAAHWHPPVSAPIPTDTHTHWISGVCVMMDRQGR